MVTFCLCEEGVNFTIDFFGSFHDSIQSCIHGRLIQLAVVLSRIL